MDRAPAPAGGHGVARANVLAAMNAASRCAQRPEALLARGLTLSDLAACRARWRSMAAALPTRPTSAS
jgi:hypothetical protein